MVLFLTIWSHFVTNFQIWRQILSEYNILNVRPHVARDHVCSLVPSRLLGHVVADVTAIDLQTFEGDVAHHAFRRITRYDGHAGIVAIIPDVAEQDVRNGLSRSKRIFVAERDLDME